MALLQDKTRAPILQADTRFRHHDTRAKTHIVGLDKRHHHTIGVSRCQIDRAAFGRNAVSWISRRTQIDLVCASREIVWIEQLLHRRVHRLGIGDIAVGVDQRQFHRLDLQMQGIHRIHRMRRQSFVAQNSEGDKRSEPLAIRWYFMQRVFAVVLTRRANPVALMCGEILYPQLRPMRYRVGGHPLSQIPPVESSARRLRDLLQSLRLRWTGKFLARLRRLPPRHKRLSKTRVFAQDLRLRSP